MGAKKKAAPKPGKTEKKAWAKAAAAIEAGLKRGSWVDIWEAALEIVERKLFVAGGYGSVATFFSDHMKVGRKIAERNIRVVKYASLDDEHTYGVAELDAVLAYLEARHGKIRGRLPVALERVRIPVVRFGEEENVPISDATVADIEAATEALE